MTTEGKLNWIGIALMAAVAAFLYTVKPTVVYGRDLGQWEDTDPAIKQWFETLMQPDNPKASCCGEADAYWCDGLHVRNGKTYCTITDDRDNVKLQRTPMRIGMEIFIPDYKLKYDRGNPTGHAIVFLSSGAADFEGDPDSTGPYVYCYVQNSGS